LCFLGLPRADKTIPQLERAIEYDMDDEDESFLSELNKHMKNKTVVPENTFEKLIDTFEKEFFKQVRINTAGVHSFRSPCVFI